MDQRKVCLFMFYKGQQSGKAKRTAGTKSTLQIQSNPHKKNLMTFFIEIDEKIS